MIALAAGRFSLPAFAAFTQLRSVCSTNRNSRYAAAAARPLDRRLLELEDRWTGSIVAPMPGIGQKIILTAWTKEPRLEKFMSLR